jgi:two-component system sensor histidine kinase UhpB
MSLRSRLIISIALALLASLALGGSFACWHAAQSVRTEMRAALAVARQTIRNAVDRLPESGNPMPQPGDRRRDLRQAVATFDGDRHIRAALVTPQGEILAASSIALPLRPVPGWFSDLLGVSAETARIAVPSRIGTEEIMLRTDTRNEVGEVWAEFRDSVTIMALSCVLTFGLIHWIVGRALRPLETMSTAFQQIGAGDYSARVHAKGPPELTRLAQAFNGMAGRLATVEAKNRHLHEQLLTLQEEERADLARDLHDEVGPFLFAVNVDAAAISRVAKADRNQKILEHVGLIQDAVGHMQRHVKAILGRLRPAGLAELGLAQAIENLAEFWRCRHPEIAITIAGLRGDTGFGEALDATIYRIIQESFSNAVRHGRPSAITVTIEGDRAGGDRTGDLFVSVSDDGSGLSQPPGQPTGRPGFGLVGMAERVAALDGVLTVADGPVGGVTVMARFPRGVETSADLQAAMA